MGRTKDEKFIICAYETATEAGDFTTPLDRYDIGTKVGMHPKGVDTVCRLLAQANFIKFQGKTDFYLTPNGKDLVLNLLDE